MKKVFTINFLALQKKSNAGQASNIWVLLWWALILLVGLSPVYGAVVFPKFFSSHYVDQLIQMRMHGMSETARLVSRMLKGLFITIPAAIIVLGMLHPLKSNRDALRFWLSAIFFTLGPILSSFLGAKPVFSYEVFIIPALLTAVFMLPPVSLDWFIRRIKALLLLVYVYGSVAAVLVSPEFALEMNYNAGLLSTVRLHGLATHANNLAPLLALYLLLEFYWPGRGKVSWLHRSITLVLLLLTQSKTTCLAMLIIVVVQVLYNVWFRMRGLKGFLHIKLIGLILCAGMIFLIYSPFPLVLAENPPGFKTVSVLSTLADRITVWEFSLQFWRENMLFGYGPKLFDADMSLMFYELYHWAPPHAHNQWFQTLGESGIFGAVGLLIYIFALLGLGLRYVSITSGGSLALVLLLLIRGLTEVPFRNILIDGNLLIHFAIFGLLMLLNRSTYILRNV